MSMTETHSPRPNYTLTDAAKLVGVSRSTIRRYRESGKFPDAFRTSTGEWMIPLTNLLANQLSPSRVTGQDQPEQGDSVSGPVVLTGLAQAAQHQAQTEQAHLRERLELAERELAVERARREGAEQTLAQAVARANDLSKALLMLEAGKKEPIVVGPATPATPPPTPAPADAEPAKKGWRKWLG
jgi:DNA-binding transcriptional MerR regulator